MTSDELFTELKIRLGNRTDLDARIKTWINASYIHISTKYRFRALQSTKTMITTDGQRTYTTPLDAHIIVSMFDETNNRFLSYKDWSELERFKPSLGKPSRWGRHGNTLIYEPTPNGAFTIRARLQERPDLLTFPADNSESPLIPIEWDEGILLKAASIGFSALLEFKKATEVKNFYKDWITEMVEVEPMEDAYLEQTLGPRSEL